MKCENTSLSDFKTLYVAAGIIKNVYCWRSRHNRSVTQNGEPERDPLKYTHLFSDQGTKAIQQMKGSLSNPMVLEQLDSP